MIDRSTDIRAALKSRQRGFFTMPGGMGSGRPAGGGGAPIPYDVVLYVRGNGPNGSTSIIDSSTYGRTLTVNGTTAISTTQSKFGGSSVKFPGVSGGNFSAAQSADFNFGSGDLTIAAWVWIDGNSPSDVDGSKAGAIANCWQSSSISGWTFSISGNTSTTGTGLAFDTWHPAGGSATLYRATAAVTQGMFHHVQVSVASGVRYLFLDGTLLTNTTTIPVAGGYNEANTSGQAINFGSGINNNYPLPLNSYVDELLIIKGRALNTSSFTPPTGPYF